VEGFALRASLSHSVIGADMEDDIIVIGATEQHLANLTEVFRRLRQANLKVNPKK